MRDSKGYRGTPYAVEGHSELSMGMMGCRGHSGLQRHINNNDNDCISIALSHVKHAFWAAKGHSRL